LLSSEPISTSVEHRDGVVVLAVAGDIDAATASVLDAAVADVLAEDPSALIVDLAAVTFLGSAGLQIFVGTYEKLSESGRFAVVADGPATSRPIQLTRLDEVFPLYPTLDDALTGLRLRVQD
jgi:anti-anti-sigma factor